MFGSTVKGPTKTTVVEGLVIPSRLDTVQATNFVLTQQASDFIVRSTSKSLVGCYLRRIFRLVPAAVPADEMHGRFPHA